ncbi:DUF222 domain-containing protein [Nocardioides zeae]
MSTAARRAPQHLTTADDPDQRFQRDRSTPERCGQAFQQLLEVLDQKDLPNAGGTGATVVVTMTLESLLGGLASASLDSGGTISAGEARRLACGAGLIPAVLGTTSDVLDLGRTARFHTRAMRLSMATRDKCCVAEGCDRPPHQCHAHHLTGWSAGGHTNTREAASSATSTTTRSTPRPTSPNGSAPASSASPAASEGSTPRSTTSLGA